jgi:hypothetical protein
MSPEVTPMTLTTLLEREVDVRLSEAHTAFICTTKWPLPAEIELVRVDFAPEPASITFEEIPVPPVQRCRTNSPS